MANKNNSNKLVVPNAVNALEKMKLEIAAELGIENYDSIDKGSLPSRINGMVGGSMTKKLVELGQQQLAKQLNSQTNLDFKEYKKEAIDDLQSTIQ